MTFKKSSNKIFLASNSFKSQTGARKNHAAMMTMNGVGCSFSLLSFLGKFPATGGMPCSCSDVCVHVCKCSESGQRESVLTTGHNQPLNGQLLTHHTQMLTNTHTQIPESAERRSSDIQNQAANRHALPQPQKSQSMSSRGMMGDL